MKITFITDDFGVSYSHVLGTVTDMNGARTILTPKYLEEVRTNGGIAFVHAQEDVQMHYLGCIDDNHYEQFIHCVNKAITHGISELKRLNYSYGRVSLGKVVMKFTSPNKVFSAWVDLYSKDEVELEFVED